MLASLASCGESLTGTSSGYLNETKTSTGDSLSIYTSEIGTVNKQNNHDIISAGQNIRIEFDAEINFAQRYSHKYVQLTYMKDNQVHFAFQKYTNEIPGHHVVEINDSFDAVNLYIKIYINNSPNAFIRITNISITQN